MEKKKNDRNDRIDKIDKSDYPGVAIDEGDDDKVTAAEIKNEPRRLNNNPRNDDM